MRADLMALLPEALLFLGGMVTLIGGSFTPRTRQWRMGIVAAAATVASLVAGLVAWADDPRAVFSDTFTVDTATGAARVTVTVSLLLILLIASGEVRDHPRESETCSLLLFGGAGALLLAGSTDLAVLVVAFLLSSIPLYGLVGIMARPDSPEAALKTYLFGALFGILLMLGAVLLYGLAGRAGYASLAAEMPDAPSAAVAAGGVLVLMGLLFKAGGVPGHFWVPDATQGASVSAAAFLTTVPKIGALVAITRFVAVLPGELRWATVLGVLAVASMTIGNLAALAQSDVRRLLGWSTVSQVGYLLAAAAVTTLSDQGQPALLFFLAGYALTNLAAFAVAAAEPDRRSTRGLGGLRLRTTPASAPPSWSPCSGWSAHRRQRSSSASSPPWGRPGTPASPGSPSPSPSTPWSASSTTCAGSGQPYVRPHNTAKAPAPRDQALPRRRSSPRPPPS